MSSHIEYQRFRRGEVCTEEGCRAKKFYIEDGKKFCQRGHEQFGFTQTQQDEDDWNAQGKKSRRKREEKERVEKILSGSEARELYLQCYQLILWKQCHWLVSIKGFPPELETVVRDLWDLRTRNLQITRDGKSGYSSATGTMMMFSSQGETETEVDTDASGRRSVASKRSRKNSVSGERLPKLIETLGLCYLGILLLKLPTSLGELYKWTTRDELVYTRAIKEVPKEMRSKLPPHFHSALEISAPLKQSALQRTIMEMIEFYLTQFEMVFPPLNTSLLILKHVRDLGLPLEIIPATRRLASLLNITFSYPRYNPKSYNVAIYPEVQLISLIVIATKLSQPFDDITRFPTSDSDATTVKVDWKKWVSIMKEQEESGLKRGRELTVKDDDVWKMDGQSMDDYLDWYQRTWIDDRDPKMPTQILDLFPLAPQDLPGPIPDNTETRVANLKAVHESLIIQEPWPETEDVGRTRVKRPGELYKRYREIEELPETARAFYELAASNAGVSLKMLVKGVFSLEVQLENWIVKERKKEAVKQRDLRPDSDQSEDD